MFDFFYLHVMNYESKTVVKCFLLNIDVAFVYRFILVKKNDEI